MFVPELGQNDRSERKNERCPAIMIVHSKKMSGLTPSKKAFEAKQRAVRKMKGVLRACKK